MKFFFDESGSFRVPATRQGHAVGIVVGVVIPETVEPVLEQRFREFLAKLPGTAFKNQEPKGRLLGGDAREGFALMVSKWDGVLICPMMLDLTTMAGRGAKTRDKLVAKLKRTAIQCTFETMQRELDLLARQVSNMSPEVVFRLACWAQCIKRAINDAVIYHCHPAFHGCWANMTFELDPVQPNNDSREQQVFRKLLPSWITAWCQKRPLTLIEEIHTQAHPFVQQWDTKDGINLGKMFRENVRFCPSRQSLGLQIADMAASVIRRAVVGIVSTCDLRAYGAMMKKSLGSPTHVHGIFSFAELDDIDVAQRYHGLVDAVEHARYRPEPHTSTT
jgi:hypothetical protein